MYNCQVLGILTLYVFLIAKRKGKKKTYPCWTTLSVSVSADACSWRERERERERGQETIKWLLTNSKKTKKNGKSPLLQIIYANVPHPELNVPIAQNAKAISLWMNLQRHLNFHSQI
jgi:hypothetical protein